jgi:predicted ferric reductase
MSAQVVTKDELDTLPPAMSWQALVVMLLAVAFGAFAAAVILPNWLPGLSASLLGSEPKAYWYLSRASAMIAFLLLWFSMASGLIITNKLARVWPGGPTAFDLHQYTSLLGLAIGLFHALILMGDHYINFSLAQVLIPFTSTTYRPIWVGIGQVGLYTSAIVSFSFYVRKRLGRRAWRLIHYLSFITFMLTLIHGITSGTDSPEAWARGLYWATGLSLIFLTVYRIIVSMFEPKKQPRPAR